MSHNAEAPVTVAWTLNMLCYTTYGLYTTHIY